jgi:hypothetical protein
MATVTGSYKLFSPEIYSPSICAPRMSKTESEKKTESAFEQTLQTLKWYNQPIAVAKAGVSWGLLVSQMTDLSNLALDHLSVIKKPFFISSFLVDVVAAEKLITGQNKKLASDPLQLAHLVLSLTSRICKIIRWLEKGGFVPMADTLVIQLKIVRHLSTLLRSAFRLAEALKEFSSPLAITDALLKMTMALISLYTIYYATTAILLLNLVLTTAHLAMVAAGA